MRHSTRFGYVFAVLLLLPAHSTKAQAPQEGAFPVAAARELAITYVNMIGILTERLFGSFLPPQQQPDKTTRFMQALSGRLQEIYVDVTTPIFARRLTAEDIRILTGEFKSPVFQAFTAALAEGTVTVMPCIWSDLRTLPKVQEAPSEKQRELARQLWTLQNEANSSPPQTGSEAANPPVPEKLQEQIARLEEEWRKRSDCIDDNAIAVFATRLTAEDLKALIALEQSPSMQKLHSVMEEVEEQLGLQLAAEFQKFLNSKK